jgi:ABC-type thiamine transport system substrate-binding protein
VSSVLTWVPSAAAHKTFPKERRAANRRSADGLAGLDDRETGKLINDALIVDAGVDAERAARTKVVHLTAAPAGTSGR